jgi:hypothetical protein
MPRWTVENGLLHDNGKPIPLSHQMFHPFYEYMTPTGLQAEADRLNAQEATKETPA